MQLHVKFHEILSVSALELPQNLSHTFYTNSEIVFRTLPKCASPSKTVCRKFFEIPMLSFYIQESKNCQCIAVYG